MHDIFWVKAHFANWAIDFSGIDNGAIGAAEEHAFFHAARVEATVAIAPKLVSEIFVHAIVEAEACFEEMGVLDLVGGVEGPRIEDKHDELALEPIVEFHLVLVERSCAICVFDFEGNGGACGGEAVGAGAKVGDVAVGDQAIFGEFESSAALVDEA